MFFIITCKNHIYTNYVMVLVVSFHSNMTQQNKPIVFHGNLKLRRWFLVSVGCIYKKITHCDTQIKRNRKFAIFLFMRFCHLKTGMIKWLPLPLSRKIQDYYVFVLRTHRQTLIDCLRTLFSPHIPVGVSFIIIFS